MTTAQTTPNGTTAMTPPPDTQAIEVFSYDGDAGGGFENQSMADRKLPMLIVLQSNSPKVVESKGKIHAGQIMNSVTGEVFEEVCFVPAVTDHVFTQWVPRDDGGGYRGRHPLNAKVVVEAIAKNGGRSIGKIPVAGQPRAKDKAPEPNELVETFEVYAIAYDAKTGEIQGFVMLPLTSTKIKQYRDWNSTISYFAPTIGGKKFAPGEIPLFAHRVKMTTVSDTNAQGTFMVPVFSPANGGEDLLKSLIGQKDPRYIAAKKLRDDVLKGLAKGAYETMEQDAAPDPEAAAPF